MEKLCKKCSQYKGLSEFYFNEGKHKSPCKSCRIKAVTDKRAEEPELIKEYRKKHHKENYVSKRKTPKREDWAVLLVRTMNKRTHSSILKTRAKVINRGEGISALYLMDMFNKQGGKCYYTGIPMDISKRLYKPSLDRVDSSLGYIKGNLVLCCMGINFLKNDSTIEELNDILQDIKNI